MSLGRHRTYLQNTKTKNQQSFYTLLSPVCSAPAQAVSWLHIVYCLQGPLHARGAPFMQQPPHLSMEFMLQFI